MISAVWEFHFTYWRASRLTDLLYLGLRYCQSRGSCSSPVNTLHLHSCINALFICFVFVADMQWGRAQPLPCYSTVTLMHYLFCFCCRYAVEESPALTLLLHSCINALFICFVLLQICSGGESSRKLCPDGLAFHPSKADGTYAGSTLCKVPWSTRTLYTVTWSTCVQCHGVHNVLCRGVHYLQCRGVRYVQCRRVHSVLCHGVHCVHSCYIKIHKVLHIGHIAGGK